MDAGDGDEPEGDADFVAASQLATTKQPVHQEPVEEPDSTEGSEIRPANETQDLPAPPVDPEPASQDEGARPANLDEASEEVASPLEAPLLTLSTRCDAVDRLLDGGLERDAVTLVFGEGGSGKTNLALQCALQAILEDHTVAFVDTEGVSPVRLQQIFSAALDEDPGRSMEELSKALRFITPYDFSEQEQLVEKATRMPSLGLVVVDSINLHYRMVMDGREGEREATRRLLRQLHHLMGFARRHHVPVLVTGQVYDGEDGTMPFARRTMEHLVKAMVRFEKRPDGSRRATILKHRSIPDGRQARFRIGPAGLE